MRRDFGFTFDWSFVESIKIYVQRAIYIYIYIYVCVSVYRKRLMFVQNYTFSKIIEKVKYKKKFISSSVVFCSRYFFNQRAIHFVFYFYVSEFSINVKTFAVNTCIFLQKVTCYAKISLCVLSHFFSHATFVVNCVFDFYRSNHQTRAI